MLGYRLWIDPNDAREIAGYGVVGGNMHGFLLVPCDQAHAETPCCIN